jgi:transcription elongation GreA/GreB family factor
MAIFHIGINTKVILKQGNSIFEYLIVSPDQVDPLEHKISLNSPLAQELSKSNKEGSIEVNTPRGVIVYEIVKVVQVN